MASRRNRERSDNAYNARRRYYRSAERNLKKAEGATGANAQRYRALARKDLENALDTYDPTAPKQKISNPIKNLASQLGIDIEAQRAEFISASEKERERAISKSYGKLESALQDENARREMEARELFNNPQVGSRIIGGFVDVWRDKFLGDEGEFDKSKIIPVLFDYFEVNSLADLLDKVESIVGDMLYAQDDSGIMYETVKILIQTKVADNSITV